MGYDKNGNRITDAEAWNQSQKDIHHSDYAPYGYVVHRPWCAGRSCTHSCTGSTAAQKLIPGMGSGSTCLYWLAQLGRPK